MYAECHLSPSYFSAITMYCNYFSSGFEGIFMATIITKIPYNIMLWAFISNANNIIFHACSLHSILTRTIAVSDSYPTIVHYKAEARVRCVVEIGQLGKTF